MADSKPRFLLEAQSKPPLEFAEFLRQAATNEEMFDSVWQRAKRCVEKEGFFNPAGEGDDPHPDPYLLMLAAQGIKSYKAFGDIEGNEYTVHEMFSNDIPNEMWLQLGPPGSGKSSLSDRILSMICGQWVHVVHGCPNNCRPESLLRLISEDVVSNLPAEFGDSKKLLTLRMRALEPCDHCFEQVFGTRTQPKDGEPCLDTMKIQPIRLSTHAGYGVSFWTPSEGKDAVPLMDSLKLGTHLCLLREPFAAKGSRQGTTPPYHLLLEAVQAHRLPDGTPYAGLVAIETNCEGYEEFQKGVNDVGAYKRRMRLIPRPYVTSISRELRVYKQCLAAISPVAAFDPFVLESIAVLAVFSRLKTKLEGAGSTLPPNLMPIERIRMLDGDLTTLELRLKDRGAHASRPRYTTGTDHNLQIKEMMTRLREAAGYDEGFEGLSVSFTKDIVGQLGRAGLAFPGSRVTFFTAIGFLLDKINEQRSTKDKDAKGTQKTMYETCVDELKLVVGSEKANVVEAWFRRKLRDAMERAFFPELDSLRHNRFVNYVHLAIATVKGERFYEDAEGKKLPASTEAVEQVLKPIEELIAGISEQSETRKFRGSLDARIKMYLKAEAERMGVKAADVEPSWDTLPELKQAISVLLARDHYKRIEICLADETRQLDPSDSRLKQEALKQLAALGYSDESLAEIIRYFRANRLFSETLS